MPNTAPLLGEVRHVSAEGVPTTLAIAQGYQLNQGDGWDWTLNYLDRTIDELSTMTEEEVDQAEDLFETYRIFAGNLGTRLAEMHRMLAAAPVEEGAFAPEIAGKADVTALRRSVESQVRAALKVIEKREWSGDEAEDVATLVARRDELLALIDERAAMFDGRLRTRIHGDLHLGQVLVAGGDVVFIDFEGEPARPLEERRAKVSPLRDVAGLIRSFDYAALESGQAPPYTARADHGASHRSSARPVPGRGPNRAFTAAYRAGNPEEVSEQNLLDLFILEKAAYEICYEAANRPAWLDVPLQGFAGVARRLLDDGKETA